MPSLLRNRDDEQRVTNAELFFDLVYVFAVTQLSHHLLGHPTVEGALQTLILLGLVWLAWAYTAWVTNWLDPARISVRLMLFITALGSLVMSAALPQAFESRGWAVAGGLPRHAGRPIGLRHRWSSTGRCGRTSSASRPGRVGAGRCCWSGPLSTGMRAKCCGWSRCSIDVLGGAAGFWVPGLNRSRTLEWNIAGAHLSERCQAFILIALGESVVVTGQTLSDLDHLSGRIIVAFLLAFLGAIGFWWIYFDRSAEGAAEVISRSDDPGRLGRTAFHMIHPIMVAGIIVSAAADELVLDHPGHAATATSWLVLGGTALFLAGHAAFKWVVWRIVPWSRIIAAAILVALVPIGSHVSSIALGVIAMVAVLAVIVSDQVRTSSLEPAGSPSA